MIARWLPPLSMVIATLGCRSPAPPPSPPPPAAFATASSATVIDAGVAATISDAAPRSTSADAGPACRPLLYARTSCYPDRANDGALDDETVAEWFRARGAKPPPKPLVQDVEGNCRRARVGSPPEDALVCELGTQEAKNKLGDPSFWHRVIGRTRVHVVRGGRVVTVFDHPDYVDTLPVVPDEEPGALFALSVALMSETEIIVSEIAPGSCTEALRQVGGLKEQAALQKNASDRIAMMTAATEDERLVSRMCKGVGRWTWKNGAFQRPH